MMKLAVFGLAALLAAGRPQDALPIAATFSTDHPRPLVGEPFTILLKAELSPGTSLVSWPDFPAQWGLLEVRQVGELTITEFGDQAREYRQPLTVVLWEPGDYSTPDTMITYQSGGLSDTLLVDPLLLRVASTLDQDDLTLRPLKPAIDLTYVPPALVIAGSGVLMILMWWWMQRMRRARLFGAESANIRALDRAMLANLKRIDRQAKTPPEVYAAVAECLRDYVTQQFQVAARELTTAELLGRLQAQLSQPSMNRLYQLMVQADLVKFAQQEPDRGDAQRYLEMAAHWIQSSARDHTHQNGHSEG
ncbi:MAG: DUF4381 family protein [Anaerolineae bacterium]|nr:DUF4381 family protein [Anaerolineae bacterium]